MGSTSKGKTTRKSSSKVPVERSYGPIVLFSLVGLAVVAIIAGALWTVAAQEEASKTPPSTATASGAYQVGTGPVVVDVFEDPMCPACAQAEAALSEPLAALVDAGTVTVNYYMLGFLGQPSVRASAAAGCAAEEGKFLQFHDVLYASQPQQGTSAWTVDDLVAAGETAGVGGEFEKCVREGRFTGFVDQVNSSALSKGVESTPAFFVNDEKVNVDQSWEQVLTAINAAAGQ